MVEYGCIPIELIADLHLEKHWKVKLKALESIDEVLREEGNMEHLLSHVQAFTTFITKMTRDTNNNVILQTLKLMKLVLSTSVALQKVNLEDLLPALI